MMTMRPPTENQNLEIFEEHIKDAVREFRINKSNETPTNRQEVFLPAMSQWLNKRIYAYIETYTKHNGKKMLCQTIAGIQDMNGFDLDYRQITLVGAIKDSRISKVSLNSNDVCKIQMCTDSKNTWRGYAHFLLPNQEVTILNFEVPLNT